MANDRVVSLDLTQNDPDSSGIGKMLFQHFDDARKRKDEAAQLDITEGIRSKYRQQENAQANVFSTGMERLRHELTKQRTDEAYERSQQASRQATGYLEGLIGTSVEQGAAMPGLTTTTPLPEGVAGPVKPTVSPIAPGALEVARDAWGKNMSAYFDKLRLTEGLDAEVAKKKVFEQMDLVDDNTAIDAKNVLREMEGLDAPDEILAAIRTFTTPGQGTKSDWQVTKTKILPEALKYAENSRLKMAIAQEITRRNTHIAELKAAAAKLTASAKIDNAQYLRLQGLHKELATQSKRINDSHAQLLERAFLASPKERAKLEGQLNELKVQQDTVQRSMDEVTNAMARWQAPSQGPTMPGGGFGGLQAPGTKDPLGVRRPPRG